MTKGKGIGFFFACNHGGDIHKSECIQFESPQIERFEAKNCTDRAHEAGQLMVFSPGLQLEISFSFDFPFVPMYKCVPREPFGTKPLWIVVDLSGYSPSTRSQCRRCMC